MDSLKGKVALITGSSSGIGRATAIQFAMVGARLALTGRNAERLEQSVQMCVDAGCPREHISTCLGDVTIEADVKNLIESVVKFHGRIDILVNNAGATRAKNVDTCTIEDLDWCFNVLVRSVFMVTKEATPYLEQTKGCMINIGSVAGLRPLAYAYPYSICKAAIDRMTQILSVGLGKKGIRVNSVNAAAVKTEIFMRNDAPGGGTSVGAQKYLDWCAKAIPQGRIGELPEVARVIVFMCSDYGKFLNGVQLPIDGGYTQTVFKPDDICL